MNKQEILEKLQEENSTPFYMGEDGLPNIGLILLVLITGILPGIIVLLFYKRYKIRKLEKQLKEIA